MVRGFYPPYTLSGPTTKIKTFLCVSSLTSVVSSCFVFRDRRRELITRDENLFKRSPKQKNGKKNAKKKLSQKYVHFFLCFVNTYVPREFSKVLPILSLKCKCLSHKGSVTKTNLTFLADISAKALTPPPMP